MTFPLVATLVGLLWIVSVSSDCANGWTAYSNTEMCIKGFEERKPFMDAMDFCAALGNGASLVSIHNVFENMHVATATGEASPDCKDAWIGLYNFDGSDDYSWADGSKLDYRNWASGYPLADIEGTMAFLDLSGKNKWVSTDSVVEARCFVCQGSSGQNPQTKISTTTSTTKVGTTTYHECPMGWKYYDGHCYHFNDTWALHTEAEAYCNQRDSTMVSITSAAEQVFVNSIATVYNVWIGLVNSGDGNWHWMDGSPLTYTNWESGYPTSNNNPYAHLNSEYRAWMDNDSAYYYAILCKQ